MATRQIAVRLPDDLVEFVDDLVGRGAFSSRASAVAEALRRERRRAIAAADAAILAASPPDADMDELAAYSARTPMRDLE